MLRLFRIVPECLLSQISVGVTALVLVLSASTASVAQTDRWFLQRDLTIGAIDDPDYDLTEVLDLTTGARGEVYIVQWRDQTINVFGRDGRFLRKIGSRGHGPGEFVSPFQVGWKGDTLWVRDPPAARVSFFNASGSYLTSYTFATPFTDEFVSVKPGPPLSDGSLFSQPGTTLAFSGRGIVRNVPLLRVSRNGEVLDTLAVIPIQNSTMELRNGNGFIFRRQPLRDDPVYDVAGDGSAIAIAFRSAATTSDRASFHVLKLSGAGDTIFYKRYSYRPKPLRGDFVEYLVRREIEAVNAGPGTSSVRESDIREVLYLPDYHPPVSKLIIGADGTIWLERERPGGGEVEWLVLDPTGSVLASVSVPTGVTVLHTSRDVVWGVEKDDLGVSYVGRFRVVRTR